MFVSVLPREVRVFFMHTPVPSQSVRKVMYFIYQLSNITMWVECFWISQISGRNIFSTTVYCMWHTGKADWTGNSNSWQTRTHCCGHIVSDTNVSQFAWTGNICCGHKFCVRDTKNVSDFVRKHFVSATNVSQFAQPKKHHEQQCFRNNVSSFARALKGEKSCWSVQ